MLGTTNINTALVRNALGASSNSVGYLCSNAHSLINKWSKWKPVSYATNVGITENQLASVNYGIAIPYYTDIELLSASTSVWTYNPPTGGDSSPYRIGDFRNYKHDSVIPFDLLIPNYIIAGSTGNLIKLRILSVETGNLTLLDFFTNNYFGVVVKKGENYVAKTVSSVLSLGENNIDISDCGLLSEATTIHIAGFVCGSIISSWTAVPEKTVYSLNAQSNYSTRDVVVYVPEEDEYGIGINGFATEDITAIVFSGNPSAYGDRITQSASLSRMVINNYALTSINSKAIRTSDSAVIQTVNVSIDGSTSPTEVTTDMLINESVNFNCALATFTNLPELEVTDHYLFTYTFNYTLL